MLGFGTPRLVWVKRNRDNRVATRMSSNAGGEPLNGHGLIVARRRPGRVPVTASAAVADVLPARQVVRPCRAGRSQRGTAQRVVARRPVRSRVSSRDGTGVLTFC